MKNWEKSQKNVKNNNDRERSTHESPKKKKLKPVEKTKYKLRGYEVEEE